MPYLALLLEREVRSIMIKRTISGMIGAGSLAHNRRDFIAENVDPDRVHLNICYQNENLKEVYKELFDDSVKRYNVGKERTGRLQITMKNSSGKAGKAVPRSNFPDWKSRRYGCGNDRRRPGCKSIG